MDSTLVACILSALALLSVVVETGEPLASLATCLSKFPQVLLNVPVRSKPPIDSIAGVAERRAAYEQEMSGRAAFSSGIRAPSRWPG